MQEISSSSDAGFPRLRAFLVDFAVGGKSAAGQPKTEQENKISSRWTKEQPRPPALDHSGPQNFRGFIMERFVRVFGSLPAMSALRISYSCS